MSLFCRHNRFMAECPICAKGTVLDPDRRQSRPRSQTTSGARRTATRRSGGGGAATAARVSRGVYASAGPYEGGREVRLEKVPGGLRLAVWEAGRLAKEAPVIAVADLPALLAEAAEKEVLPPQELPSLGAAAVGEHGASPGRSGELREELRVERIDEDRLRIARWILRPNRGWELQESPVMLPPERFAGALRAAAGRGVLAAA